MLYTLPPASFPNRTKFHTTSAVVPWVIINGEAIGDGWHQLDLTEELCKVAAQAAAEEGGDSIPSWCTEEVISPEVSVARLQGLAESAVPTQSSTVSDFSPIIAAAAALLVGVALVAVVSKQQRAQEASSGDSPCLPSGMSGAAAVVTRASVPRGGASML
jgi:hypothetical protein